MPSFSTAKEYYNTIVLHPELFQWELDLYKKILPDNLNSILDLGCGTGEFLQMAKPQFKKILGVDLNDAAVKICQQKKIPVIKADALNTKLKAGSFDVVRAKELLEHVFDAEQLIVESKRLLKKGGYLIIHVPTQWSTLYPVTNFWDDYTHVRPFSKKGVMRLFEAQGFKILYIKGYTAGRNNIESIVGFFLSKIFPWAWFIIAKRS